MRKYWITGGFFLGMLSIGFAQTAGTTSFIEIEAKGTVTFSPDSFVVLYRFDKSSINLEDRVKRREVERPIEVREVEYRDVDYAHTDIVEAAPYLEEPIAPPPPPTASEMAELRKRREEESRRSRIMRDSMLQIKQKRADEFLAKLKKLGVKIPASRSESVEEYNAYDNYNEYRQDEWLLVVGTAQYKNIDSLSYVYGQVLRSDLLDIRMKNHDELKRRAYQKAIEVGKGEAQILASAMKMKLGKIVEVKTESMGIEEFLPIVMKKELNREFRKRDNLQPELYQMMQEMQIEPTNDFRSGSSSKIIEWTWSEKVHIRYQTIQ